MRTLLLVQGEVLYLLLSSPGILMLEFALSFGMKWTAYVFVTPLGDCFYMPRAVLLCWGIWIYYVRSLGFIISRALTGAEFCCLSWSTGKILFELALRYINWLVKLSRTEEMFDCILMTSLRINSFRFFCCSATIWFGLREFLVLEVIQTLPLRRWGDSSLKDAFWTKIRSSVTFLSSF